MVQDFSSKGHRVIFLNHMLGNFYYLRHIYTRVQILVRLGKIIHKYLWLNITQMLNIYIDIPANYELVES